MKYKLWTCAFSLLALSLLGCGRADDYTDKDQAEQHSGDRMIEHIAKEHDVRIGSEPDADILVSTSNDTVTVRFTAETMKRLPPDCLPILKFSGPERSFTETEFSGFLENIHDYLLVTYGEGVRVPRE